MKTINPTSVIQNMLATNMGLDTYLSIIKAVWNTDVSMDVDFQRTFNGYYKVRRNAEWWEKYYKLFESVKGDRQVTFEFIIDELYRQTGNIEASFASKMLATVRSEMPIWDKYVVENLGLSLPKQSDPQRLHKTKDLYGSICRWYEDFLKTGNSHECLCMFDRLLPDYTWISPVKKIDFYLWSIR